MILTTTYFGSVSWYAQLARAKEPVYIDSRECFVKQTERSRCRIATANGVQTLSVPVTKTSSPASNAKPLTSEILISDHANWRRQHWNALCSAYGESPFFDYYADDIKPFFEPNWSNLYDFNLDIIRKMCELLDIEGEPRPDAPAREGWGGAPAWEGRGGAPYYQTFASRHGFIPDLSILDLLFNEGNEAILYLLK